MPAQFTPEQAIKNIHVPYIEDARADFAPGYATSKAPDELQGEIAALMLRMGGAIMQVLPGSFDVNKRKRYGYEIHFLLDGKPAVWQIAGLPMRAETPKKREQVKAQALFVVRDQLKAWLTTMVFSPGYHPLVQFMLAPGGKTIGEMLVTGNLAGINPMLPAPTVVDVKSEVVE